MISLALSRYLALCLATAWTASGANPEYRAGTATVDITPREPIRLSGYANRSQPAGTVLMPLHAKALAIAHGKDLPVVIITTDLIGLPRTITDVASARIQQKYAIGRSALLFNSSHTHTGPYIRDNLPRLFDLSANDKTAVNAYALRLTDALVEVAGRAILDLAPATLSAAHGEAHFAVNRRQPGPNGIVIGVNPTGPTDPDVPVLRVTTSDGRLKAVLFGYACHNTTLTGQINEISGDYAGFAQEAIERSNPGTTALFLMLCGADQNPNPRGTPALAKQHGEALAAEVSRVLTSRMTPVRGAIKSAFRVVELDFQLTQPMRQRYAYPVQALSLGGKTTLVALGGEVVVGYALAIKAAYPAAGVIIAGYSNDVMAYIPTARILQEGGYEAVDSMRYYGFPAPWAEGTEERIMRTVVTVMKAVH